MSSEIEDKIKSETTCNISFKKSFLPFDNRNTTQSLSEVSLYKVIIACHITRKPALVSSPICFRSVVLFCRPLLCCHVPHDKVVGPQAL
mmetsp:Transcript_25966/g.34491  ORF Transcript_25966/g.34491 Transcript_25966/m.34491 type:complete len:89 (+) Transcript_25966:51-317(+)